MSTTTKNIFDTYRLGNKELSSRIIMAPLTRCRAVDNNTPNKLIATYYGQRAGAGLIVAEGTSPSPEGLGYANIPGMFTNEHAEAWKETTAAVHTKGGAIFLQLMHTGRIGHSDNLPGDYKIIGPSPLAQKGEMSTRTMGKQPYSLPIEMTTEKVKETIEDYVKSAKLCVDANFDGIEIHSAHGYLPNQFMNEYSNSRTDEYGGSVENRCRFVLEVAKKTIEAIGAEKVGIRISPFSPFEDRKNPDNIIEIYNYLIPELEKLGIGYIHFSNIVEINPLKITMLKAIRQFYSGTLIVCGDLTKADAQKALEEYGVDLVGFGRDFIGNPDLVERFKNNWELSERDSKGWYGSSEKGYTDYAFFAQEAIV